MASLKDKNDVTLDLPLCPITMLASQSGCGLKQKDDHNDFFSDQGLKYIFFFPRELLTMQYFLLATNLKML